MNKLHPMHLMRSLLMAIIVLCAISVVDLISAQTPNRDKEIKKLIDDFTSSNWQKVHVAEASLESLQARAVPALVELLERDEKVELTNTADLIYPGAKEFYGHGWILDYDVDWINVRAGWALEELTFQNFGFREGAIKEADLLNAVINRQEVHLTDNSKSADTKRQIRAQAVLKAKTWWKTSSSSWNRFAALLEALRSDDPTRQSWTLSWIRNGKTKCDGLDENSFKKYIEPEAKKLLKSKVEDVRHQAKYLLEDKEGWWLKYKTRGE